MSQGLLVEVPCSTANLGGGFDCLGLALDLWLRVRVTLDGSSPLPASDRLARGFAAACLAAGCAPEPRVSFAVESAIPIGRGLGSSAAAAVAGALGANALLSLGLDQPALLDLCATIEGHPDNVAPILAGGATLVTRREHGYLVSPLDVHDDVTFVVAIPDFALETRRARAVLPDFVPHRVAAGAAARGAALVRGLETADGALLAFGLDDVLHVPFRRRFIPGYAAVVTAARHAGAWGATLSGSGSSIVALTPAAAAGPVARAIRRAWGAAGVQAELRQPSIVRNVTCR